MTARIGQYRLLSQLGEGGMGVVYLAEHTATGRRAALKTLRAPDTRLLHSIRAEIRALRRLRHPGIVKVFDAGIEDGVPWYAMELLGGRALEAHLPEHLPQSTSGRTWTRQLDTLYDPQIASGAIETPDIGARSGPFHVEVDSTGPLLRGTVSREVLLGWIAQVCQALAYMHGEGVVHCDIKPDNILITDSGRAVLLDFGLAARRASRLDAAALDSAGLREGTAWYMCPERIQGQDFDARADLYAVGCIIFEMLAGRSPFEGNSEAVLIKHLMTAPPSLSLMGIPVQPALEDLVARLLSKDPRDRPGRAQNILETLSEIGIPIDSSHNLPTARPFLYSAPLTGRSALLTPLRDTLRNLKTGARGAVFLGADSGMGKTRMALELVQQARIQGHSVLTGQCATLDIAGRATAAPLQAFESILQRIADKCRQGGPRVAETLLGSRAGILAPYAPWLDDLPGLDHHPLPPVIDPDSSRKRVIEALCDTIVAACDQSPMLLILDDAQWVDGLSLSCIERLLRVVLPNQPWLILVLHRMEESAGAILKVAEKLGLPRRHLGRLSDQAVGSMVREMLGHDDLPEAMVENIAAQSEGNPYFVAEYLQMILEQDLLSLDKSGRWKIEGGGVETLPVPSSIQSLVASRLAALDPAARALCESAAVLGRQVAISLLCDVTQTTLGVARPAIEHLQRRRIMEDAGPGQLRFVHDQLREVSLRQLDGEAQRALHQRAALSLTQSAVPDSARIAWHWAQAKCPEKACQAYLDAAIVARARHALDEAESHYLNAFALQGSLLNNNPGPELDMIEHVLMTLGRNDEARERTERLLQEPNTASDPTILARAQRVLGTILNIVGQMETALEHLEQAQALYATLEDLSGEAITLNEMASVFRRTNRFDEAIDHQTRSLAIYMLLGDKKGQSIAHNDLAIIFHGFGQFSRAEELYNQALEMARESGHRFGEAITTNNLGLIAITLGDPDKAFKLQQASLEISKELGNSTNLSMGLSNLANIEILRGRLVEAQPMLEQAIDILKASGYARGLAVAQNRLAGLFRIQGHLDKAEATIVEPRDAAIDIGEHRLSGILLHEFAKIRIDQGRTEEALEALEQAVHCFRSTNHQWEEGITLTTRAHALVRAGKMDEAKTDIERARQLSQKSGEVWLAPQLALAQALWSRYDDNPVDSLTAARRAREYFESSKDPLGVAFAECAIGHALLAMGRGAVENLKAAREIIAPLDLTPQSALSVALERLARSQSVFEKGRPLFMGE